RPGRWSPGWYPVPTQPQAPPCKFLGSPGSWLREDQTPGLLRALPTTGLNTRGGSFRPHCRVSMPLLTEGVPSARHRTGGRHCLYRLESAPAPAYTGYRERSPEELPPRAGSSSSYPRIILSDPSCARADCLFSL